jgi:hypothetical protein
MLEGAPLRPAYLGFSVVSTSIHSVLLNYMALAAVACHRRRAYRRQVEAMSGRARRGSRALLVVWSNFFGPFSYLVKLSFLLELLHKASSARFLEERSVWPFLASHPHFRTTGEYRVLAEPPRDGGSSRETAKSRLDEFGHRA